MTPSRSVAWAGLASLCKFDNMHITDIQGVSLLHDTMKLTPGWSSADGQ